MLGKRQELERTSPDEVLPVFHYSASQEELFPNQTLAAFFLKDDGRHLNCNITVTKSNLPPPQAECRRFGTGVLWAPFSAIGRFRTPAFPAAFCHRANRLCPTVLVKIIVIILTTVLHTLDYMTLCMRALSKDDQQNYGRIPYHKTPETRSVPEVFRSNAFGGQCRLGRRQRDSGIG